MQLQQSNLPERMKVWEALDLYASFYPQAADWRELLVQLGLEEKRAAAFRNLSGGQKQRLFIALALLPDPQLVFLDELTTGLDPQARHSIWDLVLEVRGRGRTVVLTTHFMEEAERLCDRVMIIDAGRIVALDTPTALVRALGAGQRIAFGTDGSDGIVGSLRGIPGVERVELSGGRVIVYGQSDRVLAPILDVLESAHLAFHDLQTEQPDLEDVFLALTGREMRE